MVGRILIVSFCRGAEGVLDGGSSPEPRILNREVERHTKEVAQRPERVTQSQEGLTQAPRIAAQQLPAQRFEFAEEDDVSESGGLEKAFEGRLIRS